MHRQPPILKNMRGFTLVEMLISSAISLILISGVLSIAFTVMYNTTDNLRRTHLDQELGDTLAVISTDMRRAGFNVNSLALIYSSDRNPFSQGDSLITVRDNNSNHVTSGSCITYAYDLRDNQYGEHGTLDDVNGIEERRGFRLNNGKAQIFQGMVGGDFNCTSNGWSSLTSDSVTITTLQFDANEQCFNISLLARPIINCDQSTLPSGNIMAKLISVQITLTGELTANPSIVRTLETNITIRNAQTTT